ncbi:MAG: gliding motility protein GldM [Flavobacteriaceae bacterium]
MASGGQSPRQKMINLMYLVFIAMLALNMSKEVLSAFGMMNEKLETTNQALHQSNDLFLAGLAQKATENPDKFQSLLEKGQKIKDLSEVYYAYLEDLKNKMMADVKDPSDYQVMDRSDFIDQLFFGGSSLKMEGQVFLDQRINYRNQFIAALPDNMQSIKDAVALRFSTGDEQGKVTNREGQKVDWLNYHYEGFPLIASLTNITQIQSDIMSSAQDALKALLEGQLTSEISYSNYTTLLEQEKSAFYAGETFSGNIVLGRKDATTKPNAVRLTLDGRSLNEGKDYTIEQGRVHLTLGAGNPGEHTIKGELVFLESGEETKVPVSAQFSTISKPDAAAISADKMNVVYRGLENPMTISIPGVPENNVSASAPGLRKVKGSSYVLVPGTGREVTIVASGKLPDGKVIETKQVFRIKEIPSPSATVRGEIGSLKMSAENLAISTVGALLEDFDFDLKISVKSFKVKIPGQPTLEVSGTKMDAKAQSAIKRAKRGDLIQIFDIDANITNNNTYKLKKVAPVLIELTN